MIEVPDVSGLDIAFGNIEHLPPRDAIPREYRMMGGNPYTEFVSAWFFRGRTPTDMARLKEREGVDRAKALRAIRAILASFEPAHEHKEAGAAYLLHEWFELSPE